MRAFAEMVMRGRMQACFIAFIGFALPFISSAVIGLVTLRKGSIEGVIVMLWVLLPVILSYFYSEANPYLAIVSAVLILTSLLVALVLRIVSRWDKTLIAAVLISIFFTLITAAMFETQLESFMEWANEIFKVSLFGNMLILVGMGVAINAVIGLIIARWWQALLYNPGGFQKEFHALKLDKMLGVSCLILALIGSVINSGFWTWLQLASLPLLFCGISVVHFTVKFLNLRKFWLGLMYVSMLLGPMSVLLSGLGSADSLLNLRERLIEHQ